MLELLQAALYPLLLHLFPIYVCWVFYYPCVNGVLMLSPVMQFTFIKTLLQSA